MARRLQQEESQRGQADSYYGAATSGGGISPGLQGGYADAPTSSSSQLPARPEESSGKRGFLGKLLGKSSGGSHGQSYSQQVRPGGGYPAQPMGYQQGYSQGPAYGGYGQPQYGGGYGQPQGMYGGYGGQQPPRRAGGGMGKFSLETFSGLTRASVYLSIYPASCFGD